MFSFISLCVSSVSAIVVRIRSRVYVGFRCRFSSALLEVAIIVFFVVSRDLIIVSFVSYACLSFQGQ